jgi:hypothetical protein
MKRWIVLLPMLLLPLIPSLLPWQTESPPAVRPAVTAPRQPIPKLIPDLEVVAPIITLKPGPGDARVAAGKAGVYPGSETVGVPHEPERDPKPPIRTVTFGPDGVIYQPIGNKPR